MNIEQLRYAIGDSDWINDPDIVVEAAKTLLSILENKTHKIVPIEMTREMREACWYEQYRFNGATDHEANSMAKDKVDDIYQKEQDTAAYKAAVSAAPDFIEDK
jgi:hypothetical protein